MNKKKRKQIEAGLETFCREQEKKEEEKIRQELERVLANITG